MFSELINITANQIQSFDAKLDFNINSLTSNSKSVALNDIFFAIKGYNFDGNNYISEALSSGAMAVITDSDIDLYDSRIYKVDDVRKTMALFSNAFYGFPSEKMILIGVTGTNGKTTVTNIINFVLQSIGKKTGLIGTNGNYINKRFIKTEHTTPDSIELNKLLADMLSEEIEYVIMEVSSHSLALSRVYGLNFDIGIFTNLTPEHLDFHKTMENYFQSKKLLFDSLRRISSKAPKSAAIYNCNDQYGSAIVASTEAERIAYGFHCGSYTAKNVKTSFDGMKFDILVPFNGEGIDKITINTKLTGLFNVYNILAAVAALKTLQISYNDIVTYMNQFNNVEGRFNVIKLSNGAYAVIDYSHTPDALQNAIDAIKQIYEDNKFNSKIITVFGCGGNRDKLKRPLMGKIAAQNSDYVIVTSDNPRFEDPMDIINDILKGIETDNYTVEPNRETAIKQAIELSSKDDVILIAGKGHESYQEVKGIKNHFSDREVAEKYAIK
jgi:UDP-N-acetylmuramoyl-L-alanyl-D-glutamate--2,6-diaminopimelate ligase